MEDSRRYPRLSRRCSLVSGGGWGGGLSQPPHPPRTRGHVILRLTPSVRLAQGGYGQFQGLLGPSGMGGGMGGGMAGIGPMSRQGGAVPRMSAGGYQAGGGAYQAQGGGYNFGSFQPPNVGGYGANMAGGFAGYGANPGGGAGAGAAAIFGG